MPVCYQNFINPNSQLAVWKITEQIEELISILQPSSSNLQKFHQIRHDFRKREWLIVRLLLQFLMSEKRGINISYDLNGKPHLENLKTKISISHTKNFAALILSEKSEVGVDIETIQPRIEKIAPKFISPEENNRISGSKKLEHMHIIWGAKETLFKIYGKGNLDFLKNIFTDRFISSEKGLMTAFILKNNFTKKYQLHFRKIEEAMLVFAVDKD